MIRSFKSRAAVAISLAVAAGTLFAAPAFAGTTLTTTGASLMCNVYKTGTFSGYADCWLTDTLNDNRQVYAVTQQEAFPAQRNTNSGGGGSTLYFRKYINGDTRSWYWTYKVCRQVNLGSDNCSATQRVQA